MTPFKLAHAGTDDWQAAADDCLQQLGEIPPDTNLAFLYITDHFADSYTRLQQYLQKATGVPHWVGTIGQGICCTATEYYDQPAMAVMLCDFPPHSFYLFSDPDAIKTTNDSTLQFAVVHGDPRNGQITHQLVQLTEQLGNGYLTGGLTSSGGYYYQLADGMHEGRISGVVFNEQVRVTTGLTQGCTPTGPIHTLTEAEGRYAIRIDQRPALDVLKEDIGEILAHDLQRIGGYIFAGFPVTGSDTGDYLVRNLMGVDPDHGVVAIGEYLQANQPIMFCRRDRKTAVDDLQRMLRSVQKRLPGPARGGLYFSCLGRGQHMFGDVSREMRLIAEQLGDIPLIGFYANGEIAGQRLYGYTGVLTLFS
ncbi:MAG: FIST C-terminal domain-containing protein [Gammaproteobacteria bacterium]|nr:FIST C-terminal domain-containing protein [Gammaproteobacteria bacterium]MDH5651921.1 FIST C-terminal domain-containing protein [Gammaproteobacteria bacterium]